MRMKAISKQLSSNDVGETGGHQAGILVPKLAEILAFFPSLDVGQLNPRCLLVFADDSAQRWEFAFIYYNNKFFGGTRNEYRLTRMTKYLRGTGLVPGDELILSHDEFEGYHVSYRRQKPVEKTRSGALKLGTGWRVVSI